MNFFRWDIRLEAESNNWSWGGGANKQYRLLPDCDCYHFLYYKHSVQFVETAVSDHLCHSDLLYRCVSDVLLVQAEL